MENWIEIKNDKVKTIRYRLIYFLRPMHRIKTLFYLFQSLRPVQWTKNGFILIPLLFAQKVFYYPSLILSLQTVVIFCFLTGSIYIINDLFDIDKDRMHPVKKYRPLAAGLVSPQLAISTAVILMAISFVWGGFLGKDLLTILIIYVLIQFFYNYRLKEAPILDIFCISFGFFLRVIAGGVVIQVHLSHWLIICTVLVSMFLAVGKRRHELVNLGKTDGGKHRKVLFKYSPNLLDQMMSVITGGVLLSYMLYCISPETIEKFQTDRLVYTIPLVLYGIFRYLYLIHQKNEGGAPEKILVSDLPLLLCVIFWGFLCMFIIYGVI